MSNQPSTRAERVAALRRRKRRDRECRMCARPAAVAKDGTVLKMCRKHLDKDVARKSSGKARR